MSSCYQNYSLQTKLIRHVRRNKGMYRLAACAAVAAVTPQVLDIPWSLAFACGMALYLLTGGWKWVRLAYKTLGRDLRLAKALITVTLKLKSCVKNKILLGDLFEEKVQLHPNKTAFISADSGATLTFEQADELANKIGNIFYEAGFRRGDVVALLMENRIEYVPIWLGLAKIGVITSLLNYNLRGDSLKHCVDVCECKAVIYSKELEEPLKEISKNLKVDYYMFDESEPSINNGMNLCKLMLNAPTHKPPKPTDTTLLDKVLYIYTSGTTGNPKAAVIRGTRCGMMSFGVGTAMKCTSEDICYNSLPLYHSNGGICIAGQVIFFGSTLVVKKRFSASKFFEECAKHKVTVINYIGETCRYLLAQPKRDFDKAHCVRLATGNGLRGSIWKEFQTRFNIANIGEFYGATEGNANMINNVNKVGSVGYNSALFPWVFPIKLVRVDEQGDLIRGSDGLAVTAQAGEVGELVGKIDTKDPMRQFDGYVNKAATKKKVISDVFKKGDSAFLTGDRLIQDEEGFYYFQDRTGDTFRWKGENVSTNEVEGVISKVIQLTDVCVYGVDVPGIEGKAGMACISDPEKKVDVDKLYANLSKSLPPYARPVFFRLSNEIAKTSTYKFQKNALRSEGFIPSSCHADDHLYYYDGSTKKMVAIDNEVYENINNQKIRF